MRPLSKLAILFALAAIVALTLTTSPRSQKTSAPATEQSAETLKAQPGKTVVAPRSSSPAAVPPIPKEGVSIKKSVTPQSLAKVKIPATRGAINYGWVQLPHGTPVDLVREDGQQLVVRWAGSLVKIDSALAAKGAVVVNPTPRG